jgi:hypothetical protein
MLWDIAPFSPYVNRRFGGTPIHIWTTWRNVPENDNIQKITFLVHNRTFVDTFLFFPSQNHTDIRLSQRWLWSSPVCVLRSFEAVLCLISRMKEYATRCFLSDSHLALHLALRHSSSQAESVVILQAFSRQAEPAVILQAFKQPGWASCHPSGFQAGRLSQLSSFRHSSRQAESAVTRLAFKQADWVSCHPSGIQAARPESVVILQAFKQAGWVSCYPSGFQAGWVSCHPSGIQAGRLSQLSSFRLSGRLSQLSSFRHSSRQAESVVILQAFKQASWVSCHPSGFQAGWVSCHPSGIQKCTYAVLRLCCGSKECAYRRKQISYSRFR